MNYHLHELDTANPSQGLMRLTQGYEGPTLAEFYFTTGDTDSRNLAYFRCKAWQEGHAAAQLPDDLPVFSRASVAMGGVPIPAKPKGGELVRKVLDISTAHLPSETADMIDSDLFPKRPAMARAEGWLFSTPAAEDFKEESNKWPCEAFRLVMQRAILLGCDWVLFDRDGLLIEDLPIFDW